jgi:hypothetical protein
VADQARQHRSVEELRAAFLWSDEFQRDCPPPVKFRGPASAHSSGRSERSAWRAQAKKVVRKLAPARRWFRGTAAMPQRSASSALHGDVRFVQTCDPHQYFDMWAAGSQTVRQYCEKHGYGYEAYIGLKCGHFPWHATYNRIFLLDDLRARNFRGWLIYVDADAIITDQAFDLLAYLHDKSDFAAVLSHNGEAHWSQVNCGVMILNYSHPWAESLITKYREMFSLLCEPHLRNAASWGTLPDDQDLLQYLLVETEQLSRQYIFLEHADLLNFNAAEWTGSHRGVPFIEHVLLQNGTLSQRTETIAARAKEILRSSADRANPAGQL